MQRLCRCALVHEFEDSASETFALVLHELVLSSDPECVAAMQPTLQETTLRLKAYRNMTFSHFYKLINNAIKFTIGQYLMGIDQKSFTPRERAARRLLKQRAQRSLLRFNRLAAPLR